MNLGIVMNGFVDRSWEKALDIAKSLGVSHVEPAAGGFPVRAHYEAATLLHDQALLDDWLGAVSSRGLAISAISCHGNPLHPQVEEGQRYARDLELCSELAARIGVKVVVCFAGCPGAGDGEKYPNWITLPWPPYYADAIKWQWEKRVIPFWRRMCERAAGTEIRYAFEMHPGDVVYCPETLLMLREAAGEKICCNLDPSHLFWQGINCSTAIRKLGAAIINCHAKDSKVDPLVSEWRGVLDWKHYADVANRACTFRTVGYGHGAEFWNDFVSALRLAGFDGVLSIEHEDPLMSESEGLERAAKLLRNTLFFQDAGKMTWA